MTKVEQVKTLAALGYPGDVIAKIIAGKQLTSEDERAIAQSTANHLVDWNISTAKQLNLM